VIEDESQIGRYISRLLGQSHGVVDVVCSTADARRALMAPMGHLQLRTGKRAAKKK
jgi:hypothetical protein